jgi:hypothetical protein
MRGHSSEVSDLAVSAGRSWVETRELPRFWPALCAILVPLALALRTEMRLMQEGQAFVQQVQTSASVQSVHSPGRLFADAAAMLEIAFRSVTGPLSTWVFLLLALGAAVMAWQSFGRRSQASPVTREYALAVLAILPATCVLYAFVHVTSAAAVAGLASKYLLYEIAPVSIISAAGFVGVLAPLWRRFRPAAGVVLLVGIGAFVWGTEPAVKFAYSLEGKFDYRGLWQEMAPLLGGESAVVVASTTGIAPGTWHPALHGGDRYAPGFKGGNWHAKDLAEKPDLLASVHGRVVLVGLRDYRGGHLERPTGLPREVGLIERVNLWAIWFKHPAGSAEEQLADLLGLGLTGVQPGNGAVYPFLLRAVLLARAGDRQAAAAALEQAQRQCWTEAERQALASVSTKLIPAAVLQLRTSGSGTD